MANICSISRIPIWLLLLFCANAFASKLNVPRVLLPIFKNFNTNFTLEVVDSSSVSCYKWTTSRPDIVQLVTFGDTQIDCANKVIVSAVTKERTRNTAIIFAEEQDSGQILRCDVIVDVISSLNIVTTTRELFREEAPEAFEVTAQDDQGNEFTTLEGIEFQWRIDNWNQQRDNLDGNQHTVLRFISFKDSPYETPASVLTLDNLGLHGHIVLMEGLKTGSAKVSVRLPQKEYCNVPVIEVQLMVVANLLISPSDVYMLLGDAVKFSILQIHHGKLEEVTSMHQYYLELDNPDIAHLDSETSVAVSQKLGKAKVLLHDRNVNEKEGGIKVPTASLTVTEPAYITLDILPHHNWAVTLDDPYEIVVEIFDSADHKLHIGNDVEVSLSIPEEYFHVETRSSNGTYIHGWPVEVGSAQVSATLLSVVAPGGTINRISPKITTQNKLTIFKAVSINPSQVLLPWNYITKPRYEVKLKASGGDGTFTWSTKDTSIAVVSQAGVVRTMGVGRVNITAAMSINQNNFATANIEILPPYSLEIVHFVQETEVGSTIFLHVAMFAEREVDQKKQRVAFTQCSELEFHVKIWDEIYVHNESLKTTPLGIACNSIGLNAISLGFTKVLVSYTVPDAELEDSVIVASYEPLKPKNPESGIVVLAVGSSRAIVFSGGPKQWPGQNIEHTHRVIPKPGSSDIIEVLPLPDVTLEQPDLYAYHVLCKQLGEAEVTLTVLNKPTIKHCSLSQSSASIQVYCAKPNHITLIPAIKGYDKNNCPINYQLERMVVQNYRDVEVSVTVKDLADRTFDNITSLELRWMVSDESLGSVPNADLLLHEYKKKGSLVFPKRDFQIIQPKSDKTGVLEITASIVGYNMSVLNEFNITPEYPPFPVMDERGVESTPDIQSTLSLLLVEDTVITPSKSSLFNHPKNSLTLQVIHGSGYYELVVSSLNVAEVNYTEGSRSIKIVPKADGVLKLAMIDLCLPSKPAIAEVHVLSVGSIKVDVAELVQKGSCINAIVRLFDTMGNILPVPDLALLNLRSLTENDVIEVKLSSDKELLARVAPAGEVHYEVTGLQLGDKNLIFATGSENKEVQSQPAPIQVFPPLKLFPRNVTLIVGSVFQVGSRGGPQPMAHIEYVITSPSIASVDSVGIVGGYGFGKTVLIGRAVGTNKANGQAVVYSQDSVEVNVVPLIGVKIFIPIVRIIVGAVVPLWAHGIPEELSPLILGSANPSLLFDWAVSSSNVQLTSVYHESGLLLKDEDKISMRLKAISPGRSIIFLNVTVPPRMCDSVIVQTVKFENSIEVEVFEELRVIEPNDIGSTQSPHILMAPDSELKLRTNYRGNLNYTIFQTSNALHTTALSDTSSKPSGASPIVSVSSDGIIRSYGTFGRALVMVFIKEDSSLKQIIGVTVEVKPIHYLMINFVSEFQVAEEEVVSCLPKGVEIKFSISYHDNMGNIFNAAESDIRLRSNRFDIVHVNTKYKDSYVYVTLTQQGSTMMKVWDDLRFQHATDHIKIVAGDVILPPVRTLTLGDIICFSMPLRTKDNKPGAWSSDNPNVININPELGIGRARLVGNAVIRHNLTKSFVTSIELKILPVNKIKILSAKGTVLTNAHTGHSISVPVVLRSELDKTKTLSMRSRNGTCPSGYFVTAYPFYCSIRFADPDVEFDIDVVFAVHQDFSLEKGEYVCEIVTSGDPPPAFSVLETDVLLTVESGNVMSNAQILAFMPAIYIRTPELVFNNQAMTQDLIIDGIPAVLQQLQVVPDNPLLTLTKTEVRTKEKYALYRITLSDSFWKLGDISVRMNVSIISPITSQNIQVPIRAHITDKTLTPSPCLVTHFNSWGTHLTDMLYDYRHIAVITIIIILLGTIYSYTFVAIPLALQRVDAQSGSATQLQRTSTSANVPRGLVLGSPSVMRTSFEPVPSMMRQPNYDLTGSPSMMRQPMYDTGSPSMMRQPNYDTVPSPTGNRPANFDVGNASGVVRMGQQQPFDYGEPVYGDPMSNYCSALKRK